MIVNGLSTIEVWEYSTPLTLTTNTNYYFSAWAISLNNVGPYARLRFEITTPEYGTEQIGTISELTSGQRNDNNPWKPQDRFYGLWDSRDATSAVRNNFV